MSPVPSRRALGPVSSDSALIRTSEVTKDPSSAEVRLACAEDSGSIRTFLKEHWRSDHALAVSDVLFQWQHGGPGRCHFVLGTRGRSGEILGLLGFIPTYQFDPSLAEERDFWLAIWKVKEDAGATGLGLLLMLHFKALLRPRSIGVVGMTDAVVPFHKKFWTHFGKLEHWFVPNPKIDEYRLIDLPRRVRLPSLSRATLTKISRNENRDRLETLSRAIDAVSHPKKSVAYLERRYLDHPIYDYDLFAGAGGYAVTRTVLHEGRKAVRIVDGWAQGSPELFAAVAAEHLEDPKTEYVDFLGAGPATLPLSDAGFLLRDDIPEAVVPTYFEPFEKRNVDTPFAYWSERADLPYSIVKGDADQDRPSVLAGLPKLERKWPSIELR
jgi:hypothetical protein